MSTPPPHIAIDRDMIEIAVGRAAAVARELRKNSTRPDEHMEDNPGDPDSLANGAGFDIEENIKAKKWAVFGNTYSPCEKAVSSLPPGHYVIKYNDTKGIYFASKSINTDELLELPDTASDEVIAGIETFWTKEEHYRNFKFLWKRGILLYGPPGSGKTCTVQLIANKIVAKEGVAIYAYNPGLVAGGLEILREIEPKRPAVIIMEDIDSIIDRFGETELLSLLDGEFQVDNAVFIATTNYPEKLDKRIRNRPSRFDIVKKIGMPSSEARAVFLTHKNGRLKTDADELKKWVKATENYSIAHLKEVIISVECLGLDFQECIDRLNNMIKEELSSAKDVGGNLGFV